MANTTGTRWLSETEQLAWRAYLLGTTQLMAQLDRDLHLEHDLSLPEYEILVRLSEAPEGKMRMAELADSLNYSRSRLTHTVARMQTDGLLTRESCGTDRRGVLACLTEAGMQRLEAAAPTHVGGVREYLVDAMSSEDLQAVRRAFTAVAEALGEGRSWPLGSDSPRHRSAGTRG